MIGRIHKTVEAVLNDLAKGLFAAHVENLIKYEYKVEITGKEMIVQYGDEKFIITVKKWSAR